LPSLLAVRLCAGASAAGISPSIYVRIPVIVISHSG